PQKPPVEEDELPPLPDEPMFDGDYYGDAAPAFAPAPKSTPKPTPKPVQKPTQKATFEPVSAPAQKPSEQPAKAEKTAPMPVTNANIANNVSNAAASAPIDKGKAFGMFLRALRKNCRSGVLFTMCSELDATFEGDVMVFTTESETIGKSLNRPEHHAAMEQALNAIGITQFDVRVQGAKADDFQQKLDAIKKTFPDITVEVK
ncbi:MAG: hypothetical protein J6Z36_02620, partial [Clostridia bacterium]|nr:hypothetical protein [Clostridia bacterium]